MNEENQKEIQDLVIERLKTLPSDKGISIGSAGSFTKEDLIRHVRSGDAIGKKIIDVEMSFLKSLKEGIFYGENLIVSDEA